MARRYIAQVNQLKDFIFEKCVPKKLHGATLNGPMLLELSRSYVEAINSGAVLTISTAWENVVVQECQKALTAAMKTYETKLAKAIEEKPVFETEELEMVHKECFAAAIKVFRAKAVGGKYWKLEDELNKHVEDVFLKVKQQNYQKSQLACEQIMRDLALSVDTYVLENKANASIDSVDLEWSRTIDSYNRAAKGPAKPAVAAKALARQPLDTARRVHNVVTKDLTDTYEKKAKEERARHDEEYQRMVKLHEDAILIRKNLDYLVTQLTQDNAALNNKIIKSEEEMRIILNQNLKMRKKMEQIESEQLGFLKHKEEIEHQLKKKGVNLNDIIPSDKCVVM